MTQEWVSARAVAWVIHDAPVPAGLAFTLTVIAARCDEQGRGSYQSVPTIAEKAGKSLAQIERDIKRLRDLGLLLLGDQRLAEHLPKGKRPVVYDLPLSVKGPKPVGRSKNPTGKTSDDTTPSIHAGGGMDATPRMEALSTPRIHAAATPRMDAGEIKPLNNPLNNPSLGGPDRRTAPAVVSTVEEREDHQGEDQIPTPPPKVPGVSVDLAKRVMAQTGATAEELARIVAEAGRDGVRRPGPWLLSETGAADFLDRLTALRAAPSTTRSGPPGVGDYRQAIRAACDHGTPGGSSRCALCRTQAPAQPPLAESQAPTPATPRDLTVLRETLGSLTTRSGPRRPALNIRPRTAPETPPEVERAHATLARHGNALDLMKRAREKLGGDQVHRNEVVVLAAELAREERPAPAFA